MDRKRPTHDELLGLWKLALDSPHGIEVTTDDRLLLRQQLYRARAAEPTEMFDNLAIAMIKDPTVLWIITKGDLSDGET